MFGDECSEKPRDLAPPDVMAGRNGEQRAGVVVEARQIVEAGCFHHLIEVAPDAERAVVEPPRRPDHQAGPIARHRRKLAGIGGFIQREEDQPETLR